MNVQVDGVEEDWDKFAGFDEYDPVPEDVKQDRLKRFMSAQAKVSRRRLKRKVGGVERVLIDESGPSVGVGRSRADAPEIDGKVYVATGTRKLAPGQFVDVRIERADAHDLHGTLVD